MIITIVTLKIAETVVTNYLFKKFDIYSYTT